MIVGDSSSLSRAFGKAGQSGSKLGRALGATAKVAGGAAVALGAAMATGVGIGIKGLLAHEKADARLANVLKTTSNAARTNVKEIAALADALEKKTGVDDVAIKSSAGLLLTFKNLRNEVGKGNDIFDQSVKISNDLSVALGKDLKSSSIMVGKALNDPIKGLTALGRAGVQFTEGQKEQIKAMVESGNVMGAQKLIMAELTSQVGGAAEALGGTMAGRMNILKARLEEVAESVAAKLLPVFERFVAWVEQHWPQIEAVITGVFAAVETAWDAVLRPVLEALIAAVKVVVEWVKDNWPEISRVVGKVMEDVRDVISTVTGVIKTVWDRFGEDIMKAIRLAWGFIETTIRNVLKVISGIIDVFVGILSGDWSRAWEGIQKIVGGTLGQIKNMITTAVEGFLIAAKALGGAILDGIVAGVTGIAGLLQDKLFSPIRDAVTGWVGSAKAFAFKIGSGLIDGIISGLGGLFARVKDSIIGQVQSAIDAVQGFFHIDSPSRVTFREIGVPLAEGIVKGFQESLKGALTVGADAISVGRGLTDMGASSGRALQGNGPAAVVPFAGGFGPTEQTIRIPVFLDGRQITEVVYEGLKEKSRSSGSLFSNSPGVRL